MPIVSFKCDNSLCPVYGVEYEEMFSIKEDKYESRCQGCGHETQRIWMGSAPVIQFVGKGFHCNSYDKNGPKE